MMVVSSHIDSVVLLKVLKVQVRAEERDDSRNLAKAHLESFKPGCLPLDRVIRQGNWVADRFGRKCSSHGWPCPVNLFSMTSRQRKPTYRICG